jgi:hypothetical protein
MITAFKTVIENPKEKRLLIKPVLKVEDNIKNNLNFCDYRLDSLGLFQEAIMGRWNCYNELFFLQNMRNFFTG